MIIYISNQNNHGIDRKKKPLHARTRQIIRCPYKVSIGPEIQCIKVTPDMRSARGKFLYQFCAISLQKQAILGEMWQ